MPGRTKTKREGSDPIMSNRDHDAKNIRRLARTGTIHRYAPARPGEPHGHYVVRCSAPDGTRPLFHLKPSPKSPQAEARAHESAAAITEKLWAQGLGAAPVRARAENAGAAVGNPEAETGGRLRREPVQGPGTRLPFARPDGPGAIHEPRWSGARGYPRRCHKRCHTAPASRSASRNPQTCWRPYLEEFRTALIEVTQAPGTGKQWPATLFLRPLLPAAETP